MLKLHHSSVEWKHWEGRRLYYLVVHQASNTFVKSPIPMSTVRLAALLFQSRIAAYCHQLQPYFWSFHCAFHWSAPLQICAVDDVTIHIQRVGNLVDRGAASFPRKLLSIHGPGIIQFNSLENNCTPVLPPTWGPFSFHSGVLQNILMAHLFIQITSGSNWPATLLGK